MAASPSSKPVILLTGCSRGLGLSILTLLLTGTSTFRATNVVALSRTLPPALSDLLAAHPASFLHIRGSTSDASTTRHAVDAALARWARLDALILNAGIVDFARIDALDPAAFAHVLNVNTVALVTALQPALPALRSAENGGRVVFVSSGAAVGNTAGWAAYNASKAAMNSLCRTLANEEPSLACFAIRPGVIDTDMQEQVRAAAPHMTSDEHSRFTTLHAEGKLLPPHLPAHSIAALAVLGSRHHPREKDGPNGIGQVGGFVNWDADELEGFKLDG